MNPHKDFEQIRVICPVCKRSLVQDWVAYLREDQDWDLIFWECLICGYKGNSSYEEWDRWEVEEKEN